MNENGLRTRTLFELAQKSGKQTFLDAKAELMMLGYKPRVGVHILSSPKVVVNSGSDHVIFNLCGKRDSKRFQLESYESKTVEFQNEGDSTKRSIVLHEIPGALCEYGCALESMEQFLDFVLYLCDLFGVRVSSIHFNGDQAHHLARIYSIEMFRECEHVTIYHGTLSNDEMLQLLKFRVISISTCIAEPDFELVEPISMKSFYIHDALWFKGPMLMQLDCETVIANCLLLQNAHINKFLHHWMKSPNRKLRRMELIKDCQGYEGYHDYDNRSAVKKNWDEEKFDLFKITEGLSSFKKPRDQAHVGNRLCFKRPADGMLMTVRVQYRWDWMSACYLWTCKN